MAFVLAVARVNVDGVGGETIISDREFEASINLINCAFEVSDDITAAALGCCCISSTNFFISTFGVCLVKFDMRYKIYVKVFMGLLALSISVDPIKVFRLSSYQLFLTPSAHDYSNYKKRS